jgi:hypothetical protein
MTAICQIKDKFTIKQEIIQYSIDSIFYSNVVYTVHNTSDSSIWLWFEKDSELSENQKMKEYFFKNKGDLNLFHLLVDTNMNFINDFFPVLFYTFLKYIRPDDSFIIQICFSEKLSDTKRNAIDKYLRGHLIISSNTELYRYIKLPNFEQLNQEVFYKENSIVLPSVFVKI